MATPEEMAATMRSNIFAKTGKHLSDWFAIITVAALDKHGKIVTMLKQDYSVTHGFANLIALDFLNQNAAPDVDLVALQYAAAKQPLLAIYQAIIVQVEKFGEVEISPKKAYVSLRRNKQFAIIQPSTKTRVDIGINLSGEASTQRLEAAGSFNAMVSHRVRITDIAQVDQELINWLKLAYQSS